MAADPSYPAFPIFAFIGFILSILPLSWHLQAWNSGTCYYMIWTSLACLNQFVNSIVWADNAFNPAPIWCDISTRIIIGASVGIPAASLCINRRLYIIATMQTVSITRSDKRRGVLVDSLICVLFPIICIVLSYIVQGHRFNILEEIGCSPAIYNTLPAYFLVDWWPIVLGLISAVYCILSLKAFARRRAQLHELLSSKNSGLTFGRYFRLMAMATTELALTIPISSFALYLNATAQPVGPWRSWSDTHYGFSRVDQFPSFEWRANKELAVAQELSRWLVPACALIFFAYFGLASEAVRNYKLAFWFVAKRVGNSPSPRTTTQEKKSMRSIIGKFIHPTKTESSCVLPMYIPPSGVKTMESLADSLRSVDKKLSYVQMPSPTHRPDHPDVPLTPKSPTIVGSPDSNFTSMSLAQSISLSEFQPSHGSRSLSFMTFEAGTVPPSPFPPSPAAHAQYFNSSI